MYRWTHTCAQTHRYTYTHAHAHASSGLGGAPSRPDPSAFHPVIPAIYFPLPGRHLANLRNEHLQRTLASFLMCPDWGPQALFPPGNPCSQLFAPQPPGSWACHCPGGPLGSGPVPTAAAWTLSLSLPPDPSKPLPTCGPARRDPARSQAALASSNRKARAQGSVSASTEPSPSGGQVGSMASPGGNTTDAVCPGPRQAKGLTQALGSARGGALGSMWRRRGF